MDRQVSRGAELNQQGAAFQPAFVCAGLIGLVVLTYFFVDRPLAALLRPHLSGVPVFIWLTYIVKPFVPAALITAALIAARALSRGSLAFGESAVLRLCCAVLIAGVLIHELKEVFGRTWPETWVDHNPSYFQTGTYGFFPFHGGKGYASFPSGHTATAAAFAGAVWFLWPKLRWLGAAIVLAVAAGLLGADYHWLSDILAGGIIGASTGWAAATLGRDSDREEP